MFRQTLSGTGVVGLALIVCVFVLTAASGLLRPGDVLFAGVDHECVGSLVALHGRTLDLPDHSTQMRSHCQPYSTLYAVTLPLVLTFGFQNWVFVLVMTATGALWIFFAFRLARLHLKNTGDALLAAAVLACAPLFLLCTVTFNPWPLCIAFFLATIFYAVQFLRGPSKSTALKTAAAQVLMLVSCHDDTTMALLTIFSWSVLGPILLALWRRKALSWGRIIATATLFVAPLAVYALMPGEFFDYGFPSLPDYLRIKLQEASDVRRFVSETERFAHKAVFPWHLAGYLVNWWYNTLGPALTLLIPAALIFGRRNLRNKMWWVIGPVGCLLALSLIPKKNPWYPMAITTVLILAAMIGLILQLRESNDRHRRIPLLLLLVAFAQWNVYFFHLGPRLPGWSYDVLDRPNTLVTLYETTPGAQTLRGSVPDTLAPAGELGLLAERHELPVIAALARQKYPGRRLFLVAEAKRRLPKTVLFVPWKLEYSKDTTAMLRQPEREGELLDRYFVDVNEFLVIPGQDDKQPATMKDFRAVLATIRQGRVDDSPDGALVIDLP